MAEAAAAFEALGCDQAQGHLYCAAQRGSALTGWLFERLPEPARSLYG